jgi:hypothetical protein
VAESYKRASEEALVECQQLKEELEGAKREVSKGREEMK